MTGGPSIAFRCDGTPATGLGHLSRCLGLAEALQEGGARVRFLGDYGETARVMLSAAGIEHQPLAGWDGAQLAGHLASVHGVVIDSYLADERTLQGASAVCPVLVIDDFARLPAYPCRAILNFTVGAAQLGYPDTGAARLLGPGFLLVRRRVRQLRAGRQGPEPGSRRVLLSFGGGDWRGAARASLRALHQIDPGLQVTLVAGSEPDGEVRAEVERFGAGGRLLSGLRDLVEPFAWAQVCVSGGGLTKYEAAYLGLPVAVLSRTAEEAAETVEFARQGLGWNLGVAARMDPDHLRADLEQFLTDASLRQGLQESAARLFPVDPTAEAATRWRQLFEEVPT